jgi:hypothetical protein
MIILLYTVKIIFLFHISAFEVVIAIFGCDNKHV